MDMVSLNCRQDIHAPACTGGPCTCRCHAVPAPASIREMAHQLAERSRRAREAERAQWEREHADEMAKALRWTA